MSTGDLIHFLLFSLAAMKSEIVPDFHFSRSHLDCSLSVNLTATPKFLFIAALKIQQRSMEREFILIFKNDLSVDFLLAFRLQFREI